MSRSAMPVPGEAIRATSSVRRTGARFIVPGTQPFQQWPWKTANPVINPTARQLTNWVPEADLLADLQREFETVDSTTFDAETTLIARYRKRVNE